MYSNALSRSFFGLPGSAAGPELRFVMPSTWAWVVIRGLQDSGQQDNSLNDDRHVIQNYILQQKGTFQHKDHRLYSLDGFDSNEEWRCIWVLPTFSEASPQFKMEWHGRSWWSWHHQAHRVRTSHDFTSTTSHFKLAASFILHGVHGKPRV